MAIFIQYLVQPVVRAPTVLKEQNLPIVLANSLHFLQSHLRILEGTESEGITNRVKCAIGKTHLAHVHFPEKHIAPATKDRDQRKNMRALQRQLIILQAITPASPFPYLFLSFRSVSAIILSHKSIIVRLAPLGK